MDPEAARVLIADEPHDEIAFGEGRACWLYGTNVLGSDRDRHTRWHGALAATAWRVWARQSHLFSSRCFGFRSVLLT